MVIRSTVFIRFYDQKTVDIKINYIKTIKKKQAHHRYYMCKNIIATSSPQWMYIVLGTLLHKKNFQIIIEVTF